MHIRRLLLPVLFLSLVVGQTGDRREDSPAASFHRLKRAPPGASTIPADRYGTALDQWRRMAVSHASLDAALGAWTPLGPGNFGGRTRALIVNPQNPAILYAAGVSGGVWKSTDTGTSWSPVSDLAMTNLAVGSLAMDPANANVIYAGTGEVFPFKQDESDGQRGAGIFKTTDGGATWSALTATTNNNPDFYYVSDVIVSPRNSQRVYAATGTGVWRSLDGGATWSRTLDGSTFDGGCLNFALRGDQPGDYLFATCGRFSPAGIFRNSAAEGATAWTQVLKDNRLGRMSLAVAPSTPSTVYALAMCGDPVLCGDFYKGLWAVYRSQANGEPGTWEVRVNNKSAQALNTWILTNGREAAGCVNQSSMANQGWYDNTIKVDPVNAEIVWAGGVDLFRSDDGGANWGLASHSNNSPQPNYAHSDHHVLVFHPQYNGTSNQILFAGNDGGVWRTGNARAATATGAKAPCNRNSQVTWTDLNHSYAVTQFYHGLPLADGASYIGGTQDNGTLKGSDAAGLNGWTSTLGGNGGFVAVDPVNPNVLYAELTAENQKGDPLVYKSTNGGASWSKASNGISDKGFLFIPPLAMDPGNGQRLWTGGSRVWRTEDGAGAWSAVGTALPTGSVSAIAQSTANPDRLLVGSSNGRIYRLENARNANGGTSWVSIVQPRTGYVAWLAFDPFNGSVAYAAYSSFNSVAGEAHVYKSTDGGTTWLPLNGSGAGAIPDIPVHTIAIDPTNTSRLYLGTDLGVLSTTDGGSTWLKESTGFANVSTESLAVSTANGVARLYAFTHGRGAWRVPLSAAGCGYAISPGSDGLNATGGSGSFTVAANTGCAWQAQSDSPWIHANSTGNGNGTVNYSVDGNPGALSRSGRILVGGQSFTLTQGSAACTYSATSPGSAFAAGGGPATIPVTASAGCGWQAASGTGWITVVSTTPAPAIGSGSVALQIAPNPTITARSASVTVAGIGITISQAAGGSAGGNDEASSAATIAALPSTMTQNTATLTPNAGDPMHSCTNSRDSATIWFRFVANFSGTMQVNTGGSDYDTVLSVYSGAATGPEVACNDDAVYAMVQSAVTVNVVSGQTYFIEVSSYGAAGAGGNMVLNLSANDQAATATSIGTLPFVTSQDIGTATSTPGDPVHACTSSADGRSVWFRYTATFTGSLLIDTQRSTYDTVLSAYNASAPQTELACNDDTDQDPLSALSLAVVSGQTYLIEVSTYQQASGDSLLVLQVNANDDSAQAAPVAGVSTVQFVGAATKGASDPGVVACGGPLDKTVWYRYTAPASGLVRVSTVNSDFDTVLAVYIGAGAPGVELACNDDIDANNPGPSALSFDAVSGQSYLILIGNYNSFEGLRDTLSLTVHPDTACTFTAAPGSKNFPAAGGSDSFLLQPNYPDCVWTLTPSASFIGVAASTKSGTGPAWIDYTVSPNTSGAPRSGSIGVAGNPSVFPVSQEAGGTIDLVLTAMSGPTSATAGGTVNVSGTVANQGNLAAGAFRVHFYFANSPAISTSSVDTGGGCTIPALAAGASFTCSGPVGVPAGLSTGTWYLGAIADPDNAVGESNEGNNARVSDSGAVAVTGGANRTPAPVSANPGAGSGTSANFTFTFSDPDGRQDLDVVNVLINNFLDGRSACYLAYSRPGNVLYLVADDGGTLLGLVMNGSGSVSNGQCTVNGAASSVGGTGTSLTLNLAMSFKPAFAGNKVVYMAARDVVQNNSGWQALGTWNVPGSTTFPAVTGVTPARGSGSSQTFTFAFDDNKGFQDLGVVNILINNFLDGRNACYLAYSRAQNVLYLVGDDGGTLLPGLVLNGSGSVSNGQCAVTGAGSSATGTGNALTLILNLSFKAPFNGNRVIYMAARDSTDANNSGWQSMGSWTVQ